MFHISLNYFFDKIERKLAIASCIVTKTSLIALSVIAHVD